MKFGNFGTSGRKRYYKGSNKLTVNHFYCFGVILMILTVWIFYSWVSFEQETAGKFETVNNIRNVLMDLPTG